MFLVSSKEILDWIFENPSAIRLLITFLRHADEVFTKSALVNESKVSKTTYFRLFPQFLKYNIIIEVPSVKGKLYKLNRNHPLVRALIEVYKN